MKKQIFVNLPVKDLQRSIEFFTKLGFTFNPQFTDEMATCMIIEEGASYAMLLQQERFKEFLRGNEVADSSTEKEVLIAVSLESKGAVDTMTETALSAGGKEYRAEDLGFMYTRAIEDLDGHVWELFHMDMSQTPQN